MPRSLITEIDRTGSVGEIIASNTVFIPIETTAKTEPILCKTVKELEDNFKDNLVATAVIEYELNLGYKLANHLIRLGLPVLVQGVASTGSDPVGVPEIAITETTLLTVTPSVTDPVTTPDSYKISFVGSNIADGIVYPEASFTIHSNEYDLAEHINKKGTYAISVVAMQNGFANSDAAEGELVLAADLDAQVVADAVTANAAAVKLEIEINTETIDWEALEDKNNYDIRFLTTGAFKGSSANYIDGNMVECAKNRGDCTALVGFNETCSYTDPETEKEVIFSYDVASILGILLQNPTLTKDGDNIDTGGYAAAFTPFFYTADSDFTSNPETEVLIPAPFGYLFAYARSIRNNPEWFAVAGFERGVIPELTRVKHKFSTADVNALQNRADDLSDNDGRGVNAIAYIRPAGFIIYGNRTLKKNEGELTATSFINVRNMVSLVKKVAFEAANRFTFEQNSDILWVNYKSYIEPTLDRITHGNGALGYSINKIKTTARAKLQAEIIIQPIEAVEDIELAVIMTDANTVVSE